MNLDQWEIVISVVVSAALAFAPWMLKVHARLAVLGQQMTDVEAKLDKLLADYEHRLSLCAMHQVRMDAVEKQLAELSAQLKEAA
jgi:predicted DNA-binding protein YlxM (UPF0122 family)